MKIIMNKNLLTALFAVSAIFAYGQTYQPGYIITLENDTIHGDVNVSKKALCQFKKDGLETDYEQSEIWGYSLIDGPTYKSGITSDAFVEVLVLGEGMSLYASGGVYYLEKPGMPIQKLEERSIKKIVNGVETIQKSNRWKGVLSFMLNDCDKIIVDQKKLRFNSESIIQHVVDYNNCKNVFVRRSSDTSFDNIKISGLLGVSYTSIKAQSNSSIQRFTNDDITNTSLTFGVRVSHKMNEKYSLEGEALINSFKYSQKFNSTNESGTFSVKITMLNLPFSIAFPFEKHNKTFNFRLGGVLSVPIGGGFNRGRRYNPTFQQYEQFSEEIFYARGNIGAMFGVEMMQSLKKIDLGYGVRYTGNPKISEGDKISSNQIAFILILSKK